MLKTVLLNQNCEGYLSSLPDKSIDCIITDPPYGIADVWKGGGGHGWNKARKDTPHRNGWDIAPSQATLDHLIRVARVLVIWGGNYFNLPSSRGWLVWNKPERGFTLSEAELAWTSEDRPIRVFDCHRSDYDRTHPTQKPLSLMIWCVNNFSDPDMTVLDPYMGSGTTGVACMKTGRHFIGIEGDESYYLSAAKRIEEARQQPVLFKT